MKKFKFLPSFFTPSFAGFSKKSAWVIILAAIVGVLISGTVGVKPAFAVSFTPTDCGAISGVIITTSGCQLDDTKMNLSCACNYNYSCFQAGTPPVNLGSVNMKCNPNSNLVCSNREDVGSKPVKINDIPGDEALQDWFCHIKSGSDTSCSSNQDCEAGGICQDSKCEADIGGDVVSGLFGEEISDIRDTIRMFINIALGFLGVITVIFIIYGGLIWMTAAGAEDKVTKGKNTLMWAAIGAVVISIAWTIASYVLQIGKTVG